MYILVDEVIFVMLEGTTGQCNVDDRKRERRKGKKSNKISLDFAAAAVQEIWNSRVAISLILRFEWMTNFYEFRALWYKVELRR